MDGPYGIVNGGVVGEFVSNNDFIKRWVERNLYSVTEHQIYENLNYREQQHRCLVDV